MSIVLALMEPSEAGPKALGYARRAVELDPDMSQGLVILASLQQMYEWNWDAAEQSFRRALAVSPNNAEAHVHCSLLLTCLARFEEAEQLMRRALDLDPLNLFFQHLRGVQCTWMGKHEEAVKRLAKVVARAPFMQMAHLTMWASLHALGRFEESLQAARAGYEAVRDEGMVERLTWAGLRRAFREQ
jgi:tetratricopeptide (TPR) repeat protein